MPNHPLCHIQWYPIPYCTNQIHKQACTQCHFRLPANIHFMAAGHPSYLKSARLYLKKMYALKDDNPALQYMKISSLGFT